MDDEPTLRIAGLSLWVKARQFEQSADFWDGNWLIVRVRVEAPGCQIEHVGACLRTTEIARFADQLAVIARDMEGQAELKCMEPNLDVKIVCGNRGQVAVFVSITPDYLRQEHRVEFEIDQSYLNETLIECRRLLQEFPIVGSASGEPTALVLRCAEGASKDARFARSSPHDATPPIEL